MPDPELGSADAEPGPPRAPYRILIVEDDPNVREVLKRALGDTYEVDLASTGQDGLQQLNSQVYDLALLDLHLPGPDGMSLLTAGTSLQPEAEFVLMTGEGTIESALEAMRLGAHDYLRKPLNLAELRMVLDRALEGRETRREVAALRSRVELTGRPAMIGRAPPMKRLADLIQRAAPSRTTVLITGETGTGKELVAQSIHALSDRARRPFITVQCSALSETLLESELFGHMKGSFTGATETRRGMFEAAADGTLFLDEVATLAPATQVKLLRTLQERQVQRVGANQPIPVAFRLIAATNMDLAGEVAAGRFREDLFYRLNVFPIRVPPLRERRADIPVLATFFLARVAELNGVPAPELSPSFLSRLQAHDWPGNVRELENFIERAVIMYSGRRTVPLSAAEWRKPDEVQTRAAREGWTLAELEREYILRRLAENHGQVINTALALGIDRRTLSRKLKQYRAEGRLG